MSDEWHKYNINPKSVKDLHANKNVSVMTSIISLIVKKAFES